MTTTASRRITSIDTLKGVGIILVIAEHTTNIVHPTLDHFIMPLFFIISGMLFKPEQSWRSNLISKTKRLILPTIIYTLAIISITLAALAINPEIMRARTAAVPDAPSLAIALRLSMHSLWFIKALFWALIAFHGIYKLLRPKNPAALIAIALAFTALSWIFQRSNYIPNDIIYYLALPQALYALPLIAAGAAIGYYFKAIEEAVHMGKRIKISAKISINIKVIVAVIAAALIITLRIINPTAIASMYNAQYSEPIWQFNAITIITFIAALCIALLLPDIKPITYAGRNSEAYYCLHVIAAIIANLLLIDLGTPMFLAVLIISTTIILLLQRFSPIHLTHQPLHQNTAVK